MVVIELARDGRLNSPNVSHLSSEYYARKKRAYKHTHSLIEQTFPLRSTAVKSIAILRCRSDSPTFPHSPFLSSPRHLLSPSPRPLQGRFQSLPQRRTRSSYPVYHRSFRPSFHSRHQLAPTVPSSAVMASQCVLFSL